MLVLNRLPYRPVALAGSACLMLGSAGFVLLQPELGVALAGVGLGLHALVFNVATQTGTGREDRGRARTLFNAAWSAVLGPLCHTCEAMGGV